MTTTHKTVREPHASTLVTLVLYEVGTTGLDISKSTHPVVVSTCGTAYEDEQDLLQHHDIGTDKHSDNIATVIVRA